MVLGHCQFSIFSRMAHASQQIRIAVGTHIAMRPQKKIASRRLKRCVGMRKAGNHRTRQSCHGEN